MSSRFLFALWAGGGNVPPQITLGKRLVQGGHRVKVLAPAVLRQRVEAAGLEFVPYRESPEHDEADAARGLSRDFEHRSPIAAAKAVRDRVFVGMAAPIASDVLDILERQTVDVVVTDYILTGALFAAETAKIPAAGLVHHIYPFPARGIPPFGNGWLPRPGVLGAARDALGRAAFNRVWAKPLGEKLNQVRRRLGLRPLTGLDDLVRAYDRMLVLTSRSFDFPADLPPNVRYVGPHLEQPDETPAWDLPWSDHDSRPLVVISLSTTYQAQGDLLHRAIEAVGRLPVRALLTTGPVRVDADSAPPNVRIVRFVPHARVLPHARLVVTHAGHGTVMAALAHGLPLVCLPMGRDQGDNAARVVWHGTGVRLPARSRPASIAEAIDHVLGDPAFAAAARRLAAAIAEEDAAGLGVDELRRLGAAPPLACAGERT